MGTQAPASTASSTWTAGRTPASLSLFVGDDAINNVGSVGSFDGAIALDPSHVVDLDDELPVYRSLGDLTFEDDLSMDADEPVYRSLGNMMFASESPAEEECECMPPLVRRQNAW